MPNNSVYQRLAAATSSAQKLTVVSPRNMIAPFVAKLEFLDRSILTAKGDKFDPLCYTIAVAKAMNFPRKSG